MQYSIGLMIVALLFGASAKAQAPTSFETVGVSRTYFSAPNTSLNEVCVVPLHIDSQSLYSERDAKVERTLCNYDFYGLTAQQNTDIQLVNICPKLKSSNPGVDVQSSVLEVEKSAYETTECKKSSDRLGKKLAKFKQSYSCSYTPSLLAYYHISRWFNEAGHVPVSVLRTFDREQHKIIADRGVKWTPVGLIKTTWTGLQGIVTNSASKNDQILMADRKQLYGALSENPANEESYAEVNGSRKDYDDRVNAFMRTTSYARIKDPRPVGSIAPRSLEAGVQVIRQMMDVSDMILLDDLFNQQDRFGNVHYHNYYYYRETDGVLHRVRQTSKTEIDPKIGKRPGVVIVKEMLLKDNECGVIKTSMTKQYKLLDAIMHMSPPTYRRLQDLARAVDDPQFVQLFRQETLFSATDFAGPQKGFKANVKNAAAVLKKRCLEGKLQLDLDVNAFLEGRELTDSRSSCD